MSPADIWSQCLETIREKIPRQSYETWLRPTEVLSYSQDAAVIKVPNAFFSEWIEQHYIYHIQNAFQQVTGNTPAITFSVSSEKGTFLTNIVPRQEAQPRPAPATRSSSRRRRCCR